MLSGSIDKLLCATITLAAADLDALERRATLRGRMRRPRGDRTAVAKDEGTYRVKAVPNKEKSVPADELAQVTEIEADLTADLRNCFRVSGAPASARYDLKNTYELWLTPTQTRDLRAKGVLEYRSQLPCNKLTITLEDYVAAKAPTQSL